MEHHVEILTESPPRTDQELRQQNTVSPINRLPVEILSKIFLHTSNAHITQMRLQEPDRDMDLGSMLDPLVVRAREDSNEELMWINITLVCVHWRNVALQDPALWTIPPFGFRKLAASMLQRSKNSPLTAIVSTSDISPGNIPVLLQHTPRFETLVIANSCIGDQTILQQIFDGVALADAPTLRRLRIYRTVIDTKMILPKTAFKFAVGLRELRLTFIDVDWDCHVLSNLTSLSLRYISTGRRPTAAQFRSIIERNPDLQELMLKNAFPASRGLFSPTAFPSEYIRLVHLKSIVVKLTLPQLEFLSATVVFPPSIKNISIILIHTGSYDLSSLVPRIMHQYPWSQVRSIAVEFDETDRDTFVTFSASAILASDQRGASSPTTAETEDAALKIRLCAGTLDANINLDIDDCIHGEEDPTETTMEQLFKSLPLAHITELVCSGIPDILMPSESTWADTFGTLPGLRTVIVNTYSGETLVRAFEMGAHPNNYPASGSTPTFPGLRHLEVRDLGGWNTLTVAKLRDCLSIRKKLGYELTSLKLINSKGSWDQDFDELKGLVPNVEYLKRTFAAEEMFQDKFD